MRWREVEERVRLESELRVREDMRCMRGRESIGGTEGMAVQRVWG